MRAQHHRVDWKTIDFYYSITQKVKFVFSTFIKNLCKKNKHYLVSVNQYDVFMQNSAILHSTDLFPRLHCNLCQWSLEEKTSISQRYTKSLQWNIWGQQLLGWKWTRSPFAQLWYSAVSLSRLFKLNTSVMLTGAVCVCVCMFTTAICVCVRPSPRTWKRL